MEEKLKLNKQGYEDFLNEIKRKEKELADLRVYKGRDAIYQGDNWHDNPILYQTELKEMALMKEIVDMKNQLANIEIVENIGDESLIDIGDIVKVEIVFSDDDREERLFKLVATSPSFNRESKIEEISLNSPLGTAMYHKKIGETVTYKVRENVIKANLKEKVILNLEENDKTLKKIK